jgi:hypothetical protein
MRFLHISVLIIIYLQVVESFISENQNQGDDDVIKKYSKSSKRRFNPHVPLDVFIETKLELEISKSVQKILDKMDKKFEEVNKKFEETNKKIDDSKIETNSKIDLANKKIDSVDADFKLLTGVFVALGSFVTIFIAFNFPTFIRIVFFGGK